MRVSWTASVLLVASCSGAFRRTATNYYSPTGVHLQAVPVCSGYDADPPQLLYCIDGRFYAPGSGSSLTWVLEGTYGDSRCGFQVGRNCRLIRRTE